MDAQDIAKGMPGEIIIRDLLKGKKHKIGQIDLISISPDNIVYLWEIKYQDRFEAPPFDGHGLPPWQIEFRLKVAKITGMVPMLVIVEPTLDERNNRTIYYQRMDYLMKLPESMKFTTHTGNRIIFSLDAFYKTQQPNF